MTFCTAINCMDGRVQLPVINYLKKRYGTEYVDMVTEPGPNKVLAEQTKREIVESILSRVKISVEKHGSKHIAIIGHHDCAGNPADEEQQKVHILKSIKSIGDVFKDVEVIGLWVDENWNVVEVSL